MNNQHKASINKILFKQVFESVTNAINSNKKNEIDKEVQYSINASLLMGLVLEGIINEIGELKLDNFTWKELEKSSTPLKWRIISGLIKGYLPSEEPLQTIIKLQKIRNKIAHPKTFNDENNIILSNREMFKVNPDNDFELPNNDFNIYIGYEKLLFDYNSKEAQKNLINIFNATKSIVELFDIKKSFEWITEFENDLIKFKQQ